MKAIHLVTLVALLSGCSGGGTSPAKDAHSAPSPGARQLDGGEISAQFVGRAHKSVTSGGQTFTEVLAPDGKATIEITGNPKATGNWKMAGDVICVTYSAYGEECSIVKADDQWFWFVDNVKGSTNNRFPR